MRFYTVTPQLNRTLSPGALPLLVLGEDWPWETCTRDLEGGSNRAPLRAPGRAARAVVPRLLRLPWLRTVSGPAAHPAPPDLRQLSELGRFGRHVAAAWRLTSSFVGLQRSVG